MKPVYYLDTSVFGGYFDAEFRDPTRRFWNDLVTGACSIVLSPLTVAELAPAPAPVLQLFESLPDGCYDLIPEDDEIRALAQRYIAGGVVPPTQRPDALHVATATMSRAKAIVSWNFKHLVNLRRIEGFNGINLLMGYRAIDIRSPAEVIES